MKELNLDSRHLRKLMTLMHDCLYAESSKDVLRLIDSLNDLIPFNAAILCTANSDADGNTVLSDRVNHSYPEEWVSTYFNGKFFLKDPVISLGSTLPEPYTWKSVFEKAPATLDLSEFINLAVDNGLSEGLSFICNTTRTSTTKSLLSLETSKSVIRPEHYDILHYILPHLHESWEAAKKISKESFRDFPKLTLREKEILKWAYEGKTAWEIGVILSISERTVKFHFKNIYRKLSVMNRSQAVAKAMRLGIAI